MTLSVVIPVWNDPTGLRRLLEQICAMKVFDQIIVSDDASTIPVGPDALGLPDLAQDPRLLWLRHAVQSGAGHARNIALPHITGDQVIFFDSDDLFLPEFSDLIAELGGLTFDFCIFRHVDSRIRDQGGFGPLGPDHAEWERAGALTPTPTPLSSKGYAQLCRISAYPWNKVYRTGFLRETGIRCTEIAVHNDLELHWMSFLKARRILTSARVCCEHFVQDSGVRLTNRTGRERFEVFRALDALHDALDHNPRRLEFLEPFAEFYTRLFRWITDTLDPDLRASFRAIVRAFLLKRMTEPLYTLMVLRNPSVGVWINRVLGAEAS